MMEDANYGVAADARHRAENFTRAYYKTMHKICEYALANGTKTSGTFASATLDLTAPDGKPLFASDHIYGAGDAAGTAKLCGGLIALGNMLRSAARSGKVDIRPDFAARTFEGEAAAVIMLKAGDMARAAVRYAIGR
jgi:hypothetical protein